jgi:hypothetical protein
MKPESPGGPFGLLANLDQITFHVSHLEIVRTLAVLLNLTGRYGAEARTSRAFLALEQYSLGTEFFGGARAWPETDCAVILVAAQRDAVLAVVQFNLHLTKAKLFDLSSGCRGDVGDANIVGCSGGVKECHRFSKTVRLGFQ